MLWLVGNLASVFAFVALFCSYLDVGVIGTFLLLLVTALLYRARLGLPATMAGNKVPSRFNDVRFELVSMPVSHFVEKVRWTLDKLSVKYDETTRAGLLSMFVLGQSVPALVDRQSCSTIGNSDEIIRYIDGVLGHSFTPEQRSFIAVEPMLPWQARLNEYGHAIQGFAYFYLLGDDTRTHSDAMRAWGAFEPRVGILERTIIRLGFPVFRFLMRRAFNLASVEGHQKRRAIIDKMLDSADQALTSNPYLTGPTMHITDVTFAALTAPLLPSAILFSSNGQYANGRMTSLVLDPTEASKLRERTPADLLALEESILARPCGQLVVRLFRDRKTA
eukprot:gnl/Spiro4/7386_TR3875_c0_g1_i1.p1 gnl/Spiro4/7386_TR3875_c0_g1~~gnl/Spiro4/7386_TR3875_c0_g1_i1.p1  ORF type:complete len:342 (-),score=53.40 gnl/Spiro4/7386_TR3875_c0_g1_i1:6-1007(-)